MAAEARSALAVAGRASARRFERLAGRAPGSPGEPAASRTVLAGPAIAAADPRRPFRRPPGAPNPATRVPPPPAQPQLALTQPAPQAAAPPPAPPRVATVAPARPEGDLSSYIEARRRARNDPPQVESQA